LGREAALYSDANGGGAEGFHLMAHLKAKVRKLCKESPWRAC
jgi:hypothetical protein